MSTFLHKLRARREANEQTAERAFQKLVRDVWSGAAVDESKAERILADAGRSDADLADALKKLDERQRLQDLVLPDEDAVRGEMQAMQNRIETEAAELVALKERVVKNSVTLRAQIEKLRAKLTASRDAAGKLKKLERQNDGWEKTPVE